MNNTDKIIKQVADTMPKKEFKKWLKKSRKAIKNLGHTEDSFVKTFLPEFKKNL